MIQEQVILVDKNDVEVGVAEKQEAHLQGWMHRAFSVFIFDDDEKLILQKRAVTKYHSPGLWTNTCCGHPRPGEQVKNAAMRRLNEEMGLTCELSELYSFSYTTTLENNLIENEYDHVFIGFTNQLPKLNPQEASGFRKVAIAEVRKEISANPNEFTYWFKLCMQHPALNSIKSVS